MNLARYGTDVWLKLPGTDCLLEKRRTDTFKRCLKHMICFIQFSRSYYCCHLVMKARPTQLPVIYVRLVVKVRGLGEGLSPLLPFETLRNSMSPPD